MRNCKKIRLKTRGPHNGGNARGFQQLRVEKNFVMGGHTRRWPRRPPVRIQEIDHVQKIKLRTWEAYSIEVRPPEEPDEEDFEHTPGVFIIGRDGNLRWYVSTPLL